MDIKAQIEKVVQDITKDSALKEKFLKDPAGVVKSITGALPQDALDGIIAGVKAKISADKLSGAAGALGKLLGK